MPAVSSMKFLAPASDIAPPFSTLRLTGETTSEYSVSTIRLAEMGRLRVWADLLTNQQNASALLGCARVAYARSSSAPLVKVGAQFVDRGKAHHPLRHL